MKKIETVNAVGHVLQHDITEIIPGEVKGRAFKKRAYNKRGRCRKAIEAWERSYICL
mgnify:CR=1 FL=1